MCRAAENPQREMPKNTQKKHMRTPNARTVIMEIFVATRVCVFHIYLFPCVPSMSFVAAAEEWMRLRERDIVGAFVGGAFAARGCHAIGNARASQSHRSSYAAAGVTGIVCGFVLLAMSLHRPGTCAFGDRICKIAPKEHRVTEITRGVPVTDK